MIRLPIMLPSLRSARDQAKGTVCLANMKRLGTGTALYLNDSGDRFPPFRLKTTDLVGTPTEYVNALGRRKPRWQWFIGENIGPIISPLPFALPFGDDDLGSKGQSGRRLTSKYFLCPSLAGPHARDVRNGAYGYNYQYLGNSRTDTDANRYDNFAVGSSALRAAAQTVLLADSRGAGRSHGKHSYTLDPPRLAAEKNATRFGPGGGDVTGDDDPTLYAFSPVETRHSRRGMVAFVDSHAEALRLTDLGYDVNGGGIAVPIDPNTRPEHTATNRMWNGQAADDLAYPGSR